MSADLEAGFSKAADMIRNGRRIAAFTGAGISVESGIPSFRGEDGLWSRYDPRLLEIDYFYDHPGRSWIAIKEIFYNSFAGARPNAAHHALAVLESAGLLQCVITQNIDNLHFEAGSRNVEEFHGNSRDLVCLGCSMKYRARETDLGEIPPKCQTCRGILKPDFVFFGEPIPESVSERSFLEARLSDVLIVIGTTGEVMPACTIPRIAKENGAGIIEINTSPSEFTDHITDIFLQAPATEAMTGLLRALGLS
jgi:NAD-dependent deacetylase